MADQRHLTRSHARSKKPGPKRRARLAYSRLRGAGRMRDEGKVGSRKRPDLQRRADLNQ